MQLALYSDILSDIVPVLFPLQAYYTDFGTIKRYRSYHIHHEISSERISYTCAGRGRAWKSARARKVPCLWSIGGYHSCARAGRHPHRARVHVHPIRRVSGTSARSRTRPQWEPANISLALHALTVTWPENRARTFRAFRPPPSPTRQRRGIFSCSSIQARGPGGPHNISIRRSDDVPYRPRVYLRDRRCSRAADSDDDLPGRQQRCLSRKNSPRNSAGRKRAARPSRERSRADLALVISDLSVQGRAAS